MLCEWGAGGGLGRRGGRASSPRRASSGLPASCPPLTHPIGARPALTAATSLRSGAVPSMRSGRRGGVAPQMIARRSVAAASGAAPLQPEQAEAGAQQQHQQPDAVGWPVGAAGWGSQLRLSSCACVRRSWSASVPAHARTAPPAATPAFTPHAPHPSTRSRAPARPPGLPGPPAARARGRHGGGAAAGVDLLHDRRPGRDLLWPRKGSRRESAAQRQRKAAAAACKQCAAAAAEGLSTNCKLLACPRPRTAGSRCGLQLGVQRSCKVCDTSSTVNTLPLPPSLSPPPRSTWWC